MTTNINVRVKGVDKRKFEKSCENAGTNILCAMNMLIKDVLIDNKLPFIISDDMFIVI